MTEGGEAMPRTNLTNKVVITMKENEGYYSFRDVLNTLKSFSRFFLKKWWLVVLVICIALGAGIFYQQKQNPKYEAVCTFILEDKSSGSSGLASLASQFGFNIGGISGGGMFAGDNILKILTSKKVVQQVLLSRIDDASYNTRTLADLYLAFSGIRKSSEEKKNPINFQFADIKEKMSPVQDSILNNIYETIVEKNLQVERTSKQGTIIMTKTVAANSLFARLLTERLVEQAGHLYLEVKTSNAQANVLELQRRSDSLLSLLNRKSYVAASVQPLDINPGIRSATVPLEIATRDKAVLGTLYAEVTKSLEMSKLMLSQQMPVIQVLDTPPYLLSDNKKGLAFVLAVSAFLGLFFAFVLVAITFLVRKK